MDEFKDTLKKKLSDIDTINKYNITPPYYEDWTVHEARGYGVPIASYWDCSDKLVFPPDYFGAKGEYYPRYGSWGPLEFEYDEKKMEEKMGKFKSLLENKGYKIDIVYVDLTCKGYADIYLEPYIGYTPVVFCYGLTYSDIEDLLNF